MGGLIEQEHIKPLSTIEASKRNELEGVILKNFQAFYAVGRALAEINSRHLYRTTHGTFADYCRDIFDIARATAYQLMDAAEVVENVRNCGQINIMPLNEAQVRPLTKLDPVKQRLAWQRAVESVPEGKITARQVKKIVCEITGEPLSAVIKNIKRRPRKEERIGTAFTAAFDAFLDQVQHANDTNWQTTSKEAVMRHIKALLAAIEA